MFEVNTPKLTVDAIIEIDKNIVLIERKYPPFGYALPGGFVDIGETVEEAVIREVKEETNLDVINLEQFRVYSDPKRDPRFHTASVVFKVKAQGELKAQDDAKDIKLILKSEIKDKFKNIVFDHGRILLDYIKSK